MKCSLSYDLNQWLDFMRNITKSTKKINNPSLSFFPSSRLSSGHSLSRGVLHLLRKLAVAVKADLLFVEFVIKTNEALCYTLSLKCFSLLTAVYLKHQTKKDQECS